MGTLYRSRNINLTKMCPDSRFQLSGVPVCVESFGVPGFDGLWLRVRFSSGLGLKGQKKASEF